MATMKVSFTDFPAQYRETWEETRLAIESVFQRGDFILGNEVALFEEEFARLSKTEHAIAVANGTDALILALKVLNIGSGDEVITCSNSWVSSVSSISLIGARPVLVDVDADQTISPDAIRKVISPRTKAIMPVHLTGRCARMTEIKKIAEDHHLFVIEDAAQSVTAMIDGKTSGSMGNIGSFSLHPLKNLNAAGDAGILTTNDSSLSYHLKLLRHHGLKNRDEIEFWGYNSRLDTLQAALLRRRIPLLSQYIEKRRKNAKKYVSLLKDIVTCPIERDNERHTYHVFVIQCDRRDALKKYLEELGIETKIHYPIPIHLQKAAEGLGYGVGSLPVTETQAKRILSLPIHQYLTEEQIEYVADAIKKFY